MKYRIRIDLIFEEIDPAQDIWDKAIDFISDAIIINQGTLSEERGYARLERCYHDEDPNNPCVTLEDYTL